MMGSVAPVFTPLAATEHEAVAELLHRALVGWYETRLGQGSRFGDRSEPFRLIPKVYAALDPGEAIAAREANGGAVLGVCFVHPRPTHLSVGIVAVAPEAQGRRVARGLLPARLDRDRPWASAGFPLSHNKSVHHPSGSLRRCGLGRWLVRV